MTTKKIAWAAGLFEGEGCITIAHSKNGTLQARLALGSTDEDVVRAFWRTIHVGTFYIKPTANPRHKTQYLWQCTAWVDVQHVLALLTPFLCSRRKARAREVLAIMSKYKKNARPIGRAKRTWKSSIVERRKAQP